MLLRPPSPAHWALKVSNFLFDISWSKLMKRNQIVLKVQPPLERGNFQMFLSFGNVIVYLFMHFLSSQSVSPTASGSLGHYTRLAGRRHCIGSGKLSDLWDLPLLSSYIIHFSSEFGLYYNGYKPFSWLAITTVYVHIKLFTLRNDYAQNSKFLVKLYIFIIT